MLKEELIELYKRENTKYNYEMFRKLYEIREELNNLEFSFNNLKQILDFERYVIYNKGANRFKVEESILELLQTLIIDLCESSDFDIVQLNEKLVNNTQDIELKRTHKINFNLLDFAKELFKISIPKDSFSSRRKGYAMGIISKLLNYYDIPDKFDLFIEALQSSKDKLRIEALNELHYHFENLPEEQLPNEIINELNKIVSKTKNRTIATGALNLQVITGCISEFEALSQIDDWKKKYYYN